MSFVTYAHIRNDTNKIFYIGKGVEKRAYDTRSRNKFWKNIATKHGFKTVILANWHTEQDAFEHEKVLIASFKHMNYQLVNMTDGGEGNSGYKWTDEQLKRLSEAHKGINKGLFAGSKNPSYGHTKELNKRYKGSVLAFNIKTGEQLVLEGANDMAAKGFCRGHIAKCLTGKRKTHKGFTFKRVENGKEAKDSSLRDCA